MNAATIVAKNLHDGWTLTHTGGEAPTEVKGIDVPAIVPGTTHTDLLRAGLIPDPYLDRNEEAVAWMHRASWRYQTDFAATPATEGERVDLVFDGLDTVATVTLNGSEVARTKNMHRQYRFDVRALINAGSNHLTVDFASALQYAHDVAKLVGDRPRPYPHPFNAIRKMACSFGWDWGPDLQTAGMWKGVRLERWRVARFASVLPHVSVAGGTGTVAVHVEVERASDVPLHVFATIAGQEVKATIEPGDNHTVVTVSVDNPDLWWPQGYGDAVLYDLTVDVHSEHEHLDHWTRRVGFRTVEVDVSKDDIGAGFTFVVNGERVFIKGANWIPDDHLMTRITPERLRERITQAIDANMNMLRVWGGGIYETDDFYDICDELGVMVWQDFLFACAAYTEDSPLLEEVIAEARENVTRLAPHASLVMYNGSNENIWGYCDWGWKWFLRGKAWGLGYYEDILPRIVNELDPTRFYTPSSPYSPYHHHTEKHPNDPHWGTVHEWDVWNKVDYTHYRDAVPRFCSEFGFQGPATWATIERSLPVAELHQDHPAWLLHQKADKGNSKLNKGFKPHLPQSSKDFETWHWTTQLNQARAIEFGIEHYRSHWPVCAGAIVWQLNDCWPVTSWAAIDGDGRKKPLWYALKHAYAPRLLTFQPRGADGGNDPQGDLHLVAVNDTDAAWSETLTFTRMGLDGTELAVATVHLAVEPRQAVTLEVPTHVSDAATATAEVLVADAGYPGDDDHVRALHTFVEDKDVAYEKAPFTASAAKADGGYTVTVKAHALVRNLTLLADKVAPDAVVDDALVDLVAGESHTFTVSTKAEVAADDLLETRVLTSVNQLVG
ncbi:MAG: beta-mannosidase [Actinobacteria bacterium HGW-Actinobacteria-4]|nr:MAG: beta-mannosidase [Actinobacteria bacterium HGW-Actinobacteria-4]